MRLLTLLTIIILAACYPFKSDAPDDLIRDAGIQTMVDAGTSTIPPIHFALACHLEGHTLNSPETIARYFENIRAYGAMAIAHGIPITWEVRNILEHLDPNEHHLLLELQNEGHGIGLHADSGGSAMTQAQFNADLLQGHNDLTALGITSYHVSGICSDKDWLAAAQAGLFKAVSGIVDYCLKSLPEAQQPEHVVDCDNPANCHDPYASTPQEALHPWKAEPGSNWTLPQEEGLLLIPSSGTITCAAERVLAVESATHCNFENNDVDVVLNYIDEALTYRQKDRFHQLTFVWSYGQQIDMQRFKALLEGIQLRTNAGDLVPVTTPKMMLKYEQFLGNRPADDE